MADPDNFAPLVVHVRSLLQERGFRYCDADENELARDRVDWLRQQNKAQAISGNFVELIAEGMAASSTDPEQQSIVNTVEDDEEFWSSTGSTSTDVQDTLLYRLKGPLCRLAAVQLAVYRARYQYGEPLYPPQHLTVEVGATPYSLQPVCDPFPVRITSMAQTFVLPVTALIGGYMRIVLHGRCQRQLDDMQYYTAIRHVSALGAVLRPLDMLQVHRSVVHPMVHLQEGVGVPGTKVDSAWLAKKWEVEVQSNSGEHHHRSVPSSSAPSRGILPTFTSFIQSISRKAGTQDPHRSPAPAHAPQLPHDSPPTSTDDMDDSDDSLYLDGIAVLQEGEVAPHDVEGQEEVHMECQLGSCTEASRSMAAPGGGCASGGEHAARMDIAWEHEEQGQDHYMHSHLFQWHATAEEDPDSLVFF